MERLEKILIKPTVTLKHALKTLDATARKILFVVDGERRMRGVVTDGDIRRWILSGKSLDAAVSRAMNQEPVVLREGFTPAEAKRVMLQQGIECLPVLDKDKAIISALWWTDVLGEHRTPRLAVKAPVVIMAGGEGVRMHPFTRVLPKPLIPVNERPMIEHVIERFLEYACRDFYLSVNYKAKLIKAYFGDEPRDYRVRYVEEDRPRGTAGSLSLLKGILKESFFLVNCDTLVDADYADLMAFHKKSGNLITLVGAVKHYAIPYGVCEIRSGGALARITEKPEYDCLALTGLYVLEPAVLDDIPQDAVVPITDLLNGYLKEGKAIGVYPISEKSWTDMGLHQP